MTDTPRYIKDAPAAHKASTLQQARLKQEQADREDARRYRAFFGTGLLITYLGEDYYDKPSLDAAIDAVLAGSAGA